MPHRVFPDDHVIDDGGGSAMRLRIGRGGSGGGGSSGGGDQGNGNGRWPRQPQQPGRPTGGSCNGCCSGPLASSTGCKRDATSGRRWVRRRVRSSRTRLAKAMVARIPKATSRSRARTGTAPAT